MKIIKHNEYLMFTRTWTVTSKEVSDEFVNAVKCIIKNAESKYSIHVCGPDGTGEPIITKDVIAFNGDKSEWKDYDTFSLFDGEGYCQTGVPYSPDNNHYGNPYDVVVYAVLMLAERYGYVRDLDADDATDADDKAFYLMLLASKKTGHLRKMQDGISVSYPFWHELYRERNRLEAQSKWLETQIKMIDELEDESPVQEKDDYHQVVMARNAQ